MDIKVFTTPSYGTNCYLLSDHDSAALVDPGEPAEHILRFAQQNSGKPHKLIILTHCHFDHIGGVEAVKKLWPDAVTVIGETEQEGLADNRINLSGIWTEKAISLKAGLTVSDGDSFKLSENVFKVIETPGHTRGSVCYLLGDVLFSGDTLFRESIGRADLPTADPQSLAFSLKKLLRLDESTAVLPGHGFATDIQHEAEHNPYIG